MGVVVIPVTLTVAAACALVNLWLQVRVGQVRGSQKVSVGDGGNERVIRRMRAHANFVENAPFVLALVLALELTRGPSGWLWAAGALFVIGRLLHPFGMDGLRHARTIGIALSMLVLAGLALWAVVTAQAGASPAKPATLDASLAQG